MAEKINITQVDNTSVDESVGKPKTPMHEKLFKEYNIKPSDLDAKPLTPIPLSWVREIIRHNMACIKIEIERTNDNANERSFTLLFDSNETATNFESAFQGNMFKAMNEFLEIKGENPSKFNRNIITTSEVDGIQLKISY